MCRKAVVVLGGVTLREKAQDTTVFRTRVGDGRAPGNPAQMMAGVWGEAFD